MPNIAKPTGMSVIWADSGTKTAPTTLKIAQGWVVELPPYQTANFIENKQDQFNGHVNMHGIPAWDSETEYQGNTSYSKGNNGIIYKCIATNTNVDPTNPLNSNFWTKAFEDFGTVAAVQSQLNTHITNYGTLSALTSVSGARNNLSVWSKSEADTRYAALNGSQAQVFSVATATLGHHAVRLDQVQSLFTQATESATGVAKIATTLQTSTGTDDTTIVTPLKATAVFLRKADNLSTLTNAATARTNLGLGTIAVEAATNFLRASNNLSDLPNKITARANLGLTTTAVQPESYFLRSAQNLADLASVSAARTNLGLGGAAVLSVGTLAGTVAAGDDTRIVNSVQTSRTLTAGNGITGGGNLTADRTFTLGTPSSVTSASTNSVTATSHTHDLDISGFVGTGAGTIAAGNDTRIVNATPTSRVITAGNGLTGGGSLASDRTITLGTPGTINVGTGNAVTATSHTHAFDITSFFGDRNLAGNSGYYTFPGGFIVQWGTTVVGQFVTFQKPYTTGYSVVVTHGSSALGAPGAGITTKNNTGFTIGHGTGGYFWITVGS